MTAALLAAARESGLSVRLDDHGALKVEGPTAALAQWVPKLRAHKPDLVALLSDPDPAHRLWSIALPTGERFSSSYDPPASRAEVESWHPGAKVEPIELSKFSGTPGTPAPADESAVRSWLSIIGEQDPAVIRETLTRCRTDAAALAYFIGRAREVAVVEALTEPRHARWRVTYDDGSTEVLEGNPPLTCAEARRRRPVAVSWEPQGEPDPAAGFHGREQVTCCTCAHFTPNPSTPEAGYGLCAALPAPKRPPYSGWPNARHACRSHLETPA